jgi:hypothetical protein
MSGQAKRIVVTTVGIAIVCIAIGLYIGLYLINVPGSSAATTTATGAQLNLATVPAAALNDPHPTWVSYYAVDANDQHWHHTTTYVLPANTLVHVKIFQYDSQTGLRNNFLGQASGIVGGTFLLNGKPTKIINPDAASHVFAIPEIGLSVPLEGITDAQSSANNACANAPCTLSQPHETIEFTFRTPGTGLYRWQCFVPCAAGFIQGLGGPMQTVGYMDGFIKVV